MRGSFLQRLALGAWCLAVAACSREAARQAPGARHQEPSRVITLAPNLTEIVFAIGAGPRVVATDDFSDSPPAAQRLPKVGGVEPNIERIAAAKPDLVLASASANVTPLQKAKLPLEVIRTDRMDDVPIAIEHLGAELGVAARARDVARDLRDALARERRHRAHPPRILFVAWNQPLYVGGRETFVDDLFAICGAQNAVQVKGWPQYAIESVVASPPDIILHSSRLTIPPEIAGKSRVVAVDENRFTRPGPHMVDAAKNLNAIIDEWER